MFKTYKASAGSGKTTSLVAEYLSICLLDINRYREILAITFTHNATAEMKDRIVRTLDQYAFLPQEQWGGSEKAIFGMIKKLENRLTDDIIMERSKLLLGKILYDYPNFSISTIDSFFQRILRAFAFELDINLNFEVEITLDDYYNQTIDLLFNKLSKESPELSQRILRLVYSKMEESGKWHIEGELLKQLLIAFSDERSAEPLQELSKVENFDEIIHEFEESQRKEEADLQKIAKEADQYIKGTGLNSSYFYRGTQCIYDWFAKFKARTCSANSYIMNCVEGRECFLKSNAANREEIHSKILQYFNEIYPRTLEFQKKELLQGEMKSLSLLFDLREIMNEIRERDNKFFLSETNFKLYNEIQEGDSDFLFEKIGNRYKFFFIDEFQDTSTMQWKDMVPLLHNVLSSEGTKTILFGDVKQAIYRFRNGESRLFADLTSENVKDEYLKLYPGDVKGENRVTKNLDTNYRSGEHIVAFNNMFFNELDRLQAFPSSERTHELYAEYFQDVEQKVAPHKKGKGLVKVQFMDKDDTWDEYTAKQILSAVQDAEARGYKPGDIAILTSGRNLGNQLANLLTINNYPVISSESLMLSSSDEVNLIVAVLKYLLSPKDTLARLHIIHLLLRIRQEDNPEIMAEYVGKISQNEEFLAIMNRLDAPIHRAEWLQLPLYTLVQRIISEMNITRTDAFVISFLDNVLDYISKRNNEIGPFLDWWDEKGCSMALSCPEGMNAITITTIHKSKGLQYPVVILPYNRRRKQYTRDFDWYKPQPGENIPLPNVKISLKNKLESVSELAHFNQNESAMSIMDNINKIYVAQTRPTDMMYIITGCQREADKNAGEYHWLLDDFIHQNVVETANDENARGQEIKIGENGLVAGMQQDADDPLCFWYGDREWKNPNLEKNEENIADKELNISKLHVSDFSINDLVAHIEVKDTKEQEIGNAVHNFLSKLTHFPLSDDEVDTVVFPLEQAYPEEIRAALRTIAHNTALHPYFSDGVTVLNEISILQPVSSEPSEPDLFAQRQQLVYRPDRIVITEKETVVLDYKTGNPTEKAKEKYEQQVNHYVELLREMGYNNVRGVIVYL